MKAIKIFFVVLVTVLYSCDPTRVEVLPSAPTELDYFANTDEFRLATFAIYAQSHDLYSSDSPEVNQSRGLAQLWKLPGDDITEVNGAFTEVELFDPGLNSTWNRISGVWNPYYRMIQRANVIIEKVATVDYSDYDGASEIDNMGGEALFLRGYAHFHLFLMFGDVPLITERIITEDQTNQPKTAADKVLDQVIADLNEAEGLLPESWDEANAGRATKNSARALLVKALMTRAAYFGSTADYSDALTVFGRITNVLIPGYDDVFNVYDENNAESAFEWQASSPTSNGGNFSLHNAGPWRGVELMEIFRGHFRVPADWPGEEAGWESLTRYLITDKLLNYAGDDPRIAYWLGAVGQGLVLQKYVKPGQDEQGTRHQLSRNNERVLRYGDLKLLAAEAALKSGQPGVAIGHINDVRARANAWGATLVAGTDYNDVITPSLTLPTPRNTGETNSATIMQWIMDERFVELAGEGHRWYDLIRWHKSGDIDLSGWGGGDTHFSTYLDGSPFQFDVTKHLLFPIPQDEIDRNSSITENNPKY